MKALVCQISCSTHPLVTQPTCLLSHESQDNTKLPVSYSPQMLTFLEKVTGRNISDELTVTNQI